MTTAGGRITAGVGANLIGQHAQDRNQEATCYVGNLDEQVSDDLLWELFTQAGPVNNVYVPKDRVTNKHKGHAFVEFKGEEDAEYAIKVLNMIKVYGKPIRVNKACQEKKALDVGANLFIGNLDPDVDEKMLYDTFSAFGVIVATPKIMRDPDSGVSKGFGFVSFDNFESADAAIEAMHGQFLMNRAISAQYAFKKDTNERHGTPEERLMAQNYRMAAMKSSRPNTMFASGPSNKAPVPADMGHLGMPGQQYSAPPPVPAPQYMAPPPHMALHAQQMPGASASVPSVPGPQGLLTLPLPGSAPPHPMWQGQAGPHAAPPPPWAAIRAPVPLAAPQPAAAPPPWLQRPPMQYPGVPGQAAAQMAPPPVPPQFRPPTIPAAYPPPMGVPPPAPGYTGRPPIPNPPIAPPYPQQA